MLNKLNIPVVITFIVITLFFARTINSASDTYWHMAIGRQMWETHQIPKEDKFVYSAQDTHFTSTEWLYGLILFIFYKSFGYTGIVVLRLLLIISICILLYKTFTLLTDNLLIKISLLLTVSYSLAYRFVDRPENFSYLFVALITYLIFYYKKNRKHSKLLYFAPPVFLAWPNIHPFTLVGLYLMVIYLILERNSNLKKFTKFFAILLICILFSLIQYKKVAYVLGASSVSSINNGEFMNIWGRIMLSEGYQTLNQISLHIYLYFLGLCALPIALYLNLKNRKFSENLLLIILFAPLVLIPIKYFRLIPLSILLISPVILSSFRPTKFITYTLTGILLLILPVMAYSTFVGRIALSREAVSLLTFYANNGQKKIIGAQNIFWKENFPQSTLTVMKNNLDSKRIFANQQWNNYYLWHLPNIKVFRDVLGEMQNDKTYAQADIITYGEEGWEKLLLDYNIDTVINSQDYVFFSNKTPVYMLPNWKLVYISDSASVWAREDIIKGNVQDLSAIHPDMTTDTKYKKEDIKKAEEQLLNLLKMDPDNIFAKQQIIEIKIENSQLEEAITEANNARLKFPNDPIFDLQLATIYAKLNNCQKAKIFADEAKQRSSNYHIIQNKISTILSNCR